LYAHLARSSVVETIFTRSAPAVGDPYRYSRKMLSSACRRGIRRTRAFASFVLPFFGRIHYPKDREIAHPGESELSFRKSGLRLPFRSLAAAKEFVEVSMKFAARIALVLCLAVLVPAQNHQMASAPVTLMSGLGDLHHPVSTKNEEAQQFFDQGLRLIYDLNHDEAARSFKKAAELDPNPAMAYWGVVEAVGPNCNDPASADRFGRPMKQFRRRAI
jgi:hypothetical protein